VNSQLTINIVADQLRSAQSNLLLKKGRLDGFLAIKTSLEEEIASYSADAQALAKIGIALQATATSLHEGMIRSIADLITQALRATTDSDMSFEITSVVRNGKVTLDFAISSNGISAEPLEARGGGIAALAGLFMRVVVIKMLGSRIRPILILDEPLSHLSAEYTAKAAQVLQEIAAKLGIQILMITHQPEIAEAADTVYSITNNGTTATLGKIR
jgi:DNA repair exonuclease SbcCD ATPase subunit